MINSNNTKFQFQFPAAKIEKIIETAVMRETFNRTLGIHPGNSVWYGLARVGKTTTARELVKVIKDAYDPYNPNAFRAIHFEVGEVAAWSGNEQKKGLKCLFNAALGQIDEGFYMNAPAHTIVDCLVRGLIKKNIGLALIDESGNLSLDAIRGILMAYDAAKNLGHRLSLVFIGMDDLPVKVTKLPQVEGRIHEWCFFEPYSLKDVTNLLSELHPHFADSKNDMEKREHIKLIYDLFGGFPGLIVPFIKKIERSQAQYPEPITTKYIRTIHLRTFQDKQAAIDKSVNIYSGKPYKQGVRQTRPTANKAKEKNNNGK